MDQDLEQRLTELSKKIDELQRVANTIRKLFLWTIILTVAMVVIPLIGLAFLIPNLMNLYNLNISGY